LSDGTRTDGDAAPTPADEPHERADAGPSEPGPGGERTGRKRRRRRGRGRHAHEGTGPSAAGGPEAAATPGPSEDHEASAQGEPPPRPVGNVFATLTAGLFSHIDDREVPCKVDGCDRTWTWTAAEQIQAFGQPPPRRMCAMHHTQARDQTRALHAVADREVKCNNPWCDQTWTWPKGAQLALLQKLQQRPGKPVRAEDLEPPSRVCDRCNQQERELVDVEIGCRVDGCRRTWTWTRDAQLKHRAWLRHTGAEGRVEDDGSEHGDRRGRRRRRRRGKSPDDPPPRMCEPCRQRLAALVDRESTCKVHGCTRTVVIDRESQLRAWAALGNGVPDSEVALPKRMCEVCREFCRLHGDREVPCGRPDCDRTWTYKTGAQLQAFLAGRFEDPLRLCEHCMSGAVAAEPLAVAPEGAELMPCVVPGCDGIWHWLPGMVVAPANDGDQPVDRMCARHRQERGAASDVHVPAEPAEPPTEPDDAVEPASTSDDPIEHATDERSSDAASDASPS